MFIVWLTGSAALALFAGLAWQLAPLYPGIVLLEFAFTPRAFGTVIHAWPPEYLVRYRDFLAWNFLFLACYGAFGYFFASRSPLFSQTPSALRSFAVWALPFSAALGAVENALHLWLTAMPRFGMPLLYAFSGACAFAKWLALAAFIVALIHALLRDGR